MVFVRQQNSIANSLKTGGKFDLSIYHVRSLCEHLQESKYNGNGTEVCVSIDIEQSSI